MTGCPVKHFKFRNGPVAPAFGPGSVAHMDETSIGEVAIVGRDYPGIKASLAVEVGDRVEPGQALFHDRHAAAVTIVSPVKGQITAIERGPKRSVSRIVISVDETQEPADLSGASLDTKDRDGLRQTLCSVGLWPAFRSRPFGKIPPVSSVPKAIFVNACQLTPDSPDPAMLIADACADFDAGLAVMAALADGPVHLCQSADKPIVETSGDVITTRFTGHYCAGLSGTHIQALMPDTVQRPVWTIGYQDVLAIGRAAKTGQVDWHRHVAISGSHVTRAALVRVPVGARLQDVCSGLISKPRKDQVARLWSGDSIGGRKAIYLGRFHNQITILSEQSRKHVSSSRPAPRPIVPVAGLVDALPMQQPSLPLLRALAVGDTETALALGAGRLVEEDVAPLNALSAGKTDYAVLLRQCLDRAEAMAR